MKAQPEIAARCRKKSSSSGRLHAQADIRQQHSVSVQPTPAVRPEVSFAIEEHLRVQMEIEERAHRFWLAKGSALKSALDDWLKAENEVLAEFAKTLAQRRQMQSILGEMQTKTNKTPALLPAVPCQSATKLNPKSAVTLRQSL